MTTIKPGAIIKGTLWPEPIEVKLIEEMDDYIHIVGATTLSRDYIDQIIPRDEFDMRKISENDIFEKSYGGLLRKYPKVTFDKEIAFKNPNSTSSRIRRKI